MILFIIFMTTSVLAIEPLLTTCFIVQIFMYYLTFRTKYAIDLPFMWCSSCSEKRHVRFHLGNGLFSCFIIFCIVLDFFRAIIKKDGLF